MQTTIRKGQLFTGKSKGQKAVWKVTQRIKTDERNVVYTKVVSGKPQRKKYTGKQFGFLLGKKIICLIP